MLILNSIRSAFVHIPKTGGTSVATAIKQCSSDHWFYDENSGVHASIQFMHGQDLGRFIDNYIVQVRNPYDRFISAYYHQLPDQQYTIDEMLNFLDNNLTFPDTKLLTPQHQYIKINSDYIKRYSKEYTVSIFRTEDGDIWKYLRSLGYPVFERHERKSDKLFITVNDLTNKQREIIYNYYKKDFGKFGYDE